MSNDNGKPFIEIRYKRAKDLTNRDAVRVRFRHPETRQFLTGWTEVLDVYTEWDGRNLLEKEWGGVPAEVAELADRMEGAVNYTVIRVAVPEASHGADIAWDWLGFYGFDLVEVQSEPAWTPRSEETGPQDDAQPA